jgi:SagB-type dehydrogenase family enzyme
VNGSALAAPNGSTIAPPERGAAPATPRPALRRGLLAVPAGQALLVEGGRRRHLLTGGAVTPVLPLWPSLRLLLAGAHDRTTICAETGLNHAVLDAFLGLLAECGALEPASGGRPVSGERPGAQARPGGPVLAFLSRAAEGHRSAEELAAVLAGSSVLVVAPRAVGEQIAADLAETGVGSLTVTDGPGQIPEAALRAAASGAQGVAVVFDDLHASDGGDNLAGAIARCHDHGLPVLRFAGGTGLEIGPVFRVGGPVCAGCFTRGHQAAAWGAPAPDGEGDHGRPARPPAAEDVLAGLVTAELLALLADLTRPAPPRMLARMTLPDYHPEFYDVIPEPDCSRCGGQPPTLAAATVAETYEWLEAGEPAELAGRQSAHTPAELRRVATVLARRDQMTPGPRIPLAGLADLGAAGMLGQLEGWRPAAAPGAPARFDPSDGDIASVQAYLLTDPHVADLPATIFRYDCAARELVATRADPVPLAHALASTDLNPAALDFALVLVASVNQLRYRYGTAALRMSHLDAGCAATQLSAAATRCGRPVSFASCWSRELADLLELDPDHEVVAAVAGIRHDPGEPLACP